MPGSLLETQRAFSRLETISQAHQCADQPENVVYSAQTKVTPIYQRIKS